jgi:hypothetical protein
VLAALFCHDRARPTAALDGDEKQGTFARADGCPDMRMETLMTPDPREPSEKPPMPAPIWTPDPPIDEPEPDQLPDEAPVPNPDETRNPPVYTPSGNVA